MDVNSYEQENAKVIIIDDDDSVLKTTTLHIRRRRLSDRSILRQVRKQSTNSIIISMLWF